MGKEPHSQLAMLAQECQDCGLCLGACDLLAEAAGTPGELAQGGVGAYEAYSCFLCDRCAAACPLGLKPSAIFAARRIVAVEKGEIDPDEYSYLFPDREESIMRLYRRYYNIDYSDIAAGKGTETCFFPGCTLMTYSPVLTREVYRRLRAGCGCRGILTDCCGKPLSQMGLRQRAEQAARSLMNKMAHIGVKRVIVACPGCYYHLRHLLEQEGIEVLTVYEVLDFQRQMPENAPLCTVHDSCPDRFEGIFAAQVREALRKDGYELVEMPFSGRDAPCCGSGGQVSHFRPELAEKLVEKRLSEAEKSGAEILIAYCLSCVLNFAGKPSGIKARHALNLLLGHEEDYSDVKARALQIFTEPEPTE
ncbi:MAG: (Fe-S)-binding protein [Firmicutes bacterium]|nr:(Fe-S)-binding protein [Bacillota bacterium]